MNHIAAPTRVRANNEYTGDERRALSRGLITRPFKGFGSTSLPHRRQNSSNAWFTRPQLRHFLLLIREPRGKRDRERFTNLRLIEQGCQQVLTLGGFAFEDCLCLFQSECMKLFSQLRPA